MREKEKSQTSFRFPAGVKKELEAPVSPEGIAFPPLTF